MSRIHEKAQEFTVQYAYPVMVLDPLTVIAIIRLAITLYECFSGRALLRTMRSSWGLGSWLRKRALNRAIGKTDLGDMSQEGRRALAEELDEFVVDTFRSMSDADALAFIDEAYEYMGFGHNGMP